MLPSYCVCSHHRSISLPLRWQAPNIQTIPHFGWQPLHSSLASLAPLPPLTEQKSTRVRTPGHTGGGGPRAKVTRRKRPLPRENVGNVLRAGRDEGNPAKQKARIMLPSRCCQPQTSHWSLTVQSLSSVYPHAFFCCLPLPCHCPVRCMRVIQLKGYSGLSRLCWRSVTPSYSTLPASPTNPLTKCQKLNHIMS